MSLFLTFSFEKFLLLKPAAPYKEGAVLSHSPPLQLDEELSGSGPITTKLSTLPIWCIGSLWVYYFIFIPLPVTSSNQVSLGTAQTKSPAADLVGTRPGAAASLVPVLVSGDLIVLKQSLYRLIFQCPLHFLVSYLHICCGTVSCSLCSSVDWVGVSPVCSGKWTPLPPISQPS